MVREELRGGGGADTTRQFKEHRFLTPVPRPEINKDEDEILDNKQ